MIEVKNTDDNRKVFYVDVGDMPIEQARKIIEKIKKDFKHDKHDLG